ncbi:MAG TPA: leucyl aminopeptidase [Prochlorococcus sp.]
MEICLFPATLNSWTGDVLVVGMLEGDMEERLKDLEKRCGGSLEQSLKQKMFTAKSGEIASFQLLQSKPSQLVIVGLGEAQKLILDDLRKAAALGARASIGSSGTLGMMLPWETLTSPSAAKAVAEAVRLSLYKDVRFRSAPKPRSTPTKLELIGLPDSAGSDLQAVHPTCAGVELARELVASPPNSLTPASLADTAAQLAHEHGLELKVLERSDCAERGMGAYLAVCQGSDLDPKFIHLTYRPQGPVKRRLALVGKGLTFDSGGYNLKVGTAQIELMKFDMGGSAAVLGAARAIAELRPKGVEVHIIVAACENMINGSAVHPGDIVRAANGTTIEINNTDAEGRLTLADALVYACEQEPDAIVDLATLTGACVIALGDEMAGLWSADEQLAQGLSTAAEAAGEGIWRMPLRSSYKDGLKSLYADLKNTGPRPGGSITAALFLKEFIDDSIPWAHIDIAGTVWSEKGRGLDPSGATGYGVRTLVNWICNQS